jgi:hypothetical protein
MNPLKSVETILSNLVEGGFRRMFRSEVRPMELARKLAREMDEHRTFSVSRVYGPNEYAVWLSPQDRGRYDGVEGEVIDELSAYLLEHARREDLILVSHPVITFHTDERLALGEFGIQARLVSLEDRPQAAPVSVPTAGPPPAEHGETMIYSTAARLRPSPPARGRAPARRALLGVGGRRLLIPPAGGTIGRSRDCDVVIDDVGISRHHAEIRPSAGGWTVADLGSTNGVSVNGRSVHGAQELRPGDRLELGSTEILFELG